MRKCTSGRESRPWLTSCSHGLSVRQRPSVPMFLVTHQVLNLRAAFLCDAGLRFSSLYRTNFASEVRHPPCRLNPHLCRNYKHRKKGRLGGRTLVVYAELCRTFSRPSPQITTPETRVFCAACWPLNWLKVVRQLLRTETRCTLGNKW